jgi:hypothetical protein
LVDTSQETVDKASWESLKGFAFDFIVGDEAACPVGTDTDVSSVEANP